MSSPSWWRSSSRTQVNFSNKTMVEMPIERKNKGWRNLVWGLCRSKRCFCKVSTRRKLRRRHMTRICKQVMKRCLRRRFPSKLQLISDNRETSTNGLNTSRRVSPLQSMNLRQRRSRTGTSKLPWRQPLHMMQMTSSIYCCASIQRSTWYPRNSRNGKMKLYPRKHRLLSGQSSSRLTKDFCLWDHSLMMRNCSSGETIPIWSYRQTGTSTFSFWCLAKRRSRLTATCSLKSTLASTKSSIIVWPPRNLHGKPKTLKYGRQPYVLRPAVVITVRKSAVGFMQISSHMMAALTLKVELLMRKDNWRLTRPTWLMHWRHLRESRTFLIRNHRKTTSY